MNYKIQNIKYYNFTSSDQLLLDTNIWFYLYGPQSPTNAPVRIYSAALKNILQTKSIIYIDILIVSEFINSYAKFQFNLVKKNFGGDFKIFRNSPDFKPIASSIAIALKKIINHCSRIEDDFKTLAINDLIQEYGHGNSDFNDQILTQLCKKNGFILVTNDTDFYDKKISILTANPKLLKKKPSKNGP